MSGETFEYAIKKDVRNNPIVREIERERHREMWRSVASACSWSPSCCSRHGSISSCCGTATASSRCSGSALQRRTSHRHLRLEIDTLRSPARIERLATSGCTWCRPARTRRWSIERVVPAPPPRLGRGAPMTGERENGG